MKATLKKLELQFISPAQTSRGTLVTKPSWYFFIYGEEHTGVGECSVIPGLHREYNDYYEKKVLQVTIQLNAGWIPTLSELEDFPSIRFGLECAFLDLKNKEEGILFPSPFTQGEQGIPINGLIWMGTIQEMRQRISEKLDMGCRVLKLKVGALDLDRETALLRGIREQYSPRELEIRLDANGAFEARNAYDILGRLSEFNIHSIEQPIRAGQWDEMAQLCSTSPVPIALDEELIGISYREANNLLSHIRPQYIILKPGLLGGLDMADKWIQAASQNNAGWWATSALESNVGLNAIAQWAATKKTTLVQGLGTGQLYRQNIPSPLVNKGCSLWYDPALRWDYSHSKTGFISFEVP